MTALIRTKKLKCRTHPPPSDQFIAVLSAHDIFTSETLSINPSTSTPRNSHSSLSLSLSLSVSPFQILILSLSYTFRIRPSLSLLSLSLSKVVILVGIFLVLRIRSSDTQYELGNPSLCLFSCEIGVEVDSFSGESNLSVEMGMVEKRSTKTLAEILDSESAKQENGDKEFGETDILGKNGSLDAEKGDLVEGKNGDGEGKIGEKDRVEENGVSLDENGSVPSGKTEASIEGVNENEDVEAEDSVSEGHEFCVGDFVWGKIKSHPWWPGQIYDPSYASDYASKIKSKGRHLVAYFGDGTFAWCQSSQLKPFEENFGEMSKQSNMKTFVSAVQQAVDEIGRVLELKMVCSCVLKQKRTRLGKLVAENAGIKQGSLVPEGEIRKLSGVLAEPSELLAELKRVAQVVYVTNLLELRVLKSRLSAFYHAKGGYELPRYYDPKPVHGLDDGEKSIEVPTKGPFDDWLPVAIDVSTVQADESWLQSNPEFSENGRTPKKKERFIADLIATKETVPPSGAKKRKSKGESDQDDEISLTSLKGKKKRSSTSKVSSVEKNESSRRKEKTKEGVRSRGRPKKKVVDFKNADGESKNEAGVGSASRNLQSEIGSLKSDDSVDKELERSSSFRERKKSKYLSPPFTNLNSKRKRDSGNEIEVSTEDRAGEEVDMSSDRKIISPQLLKCSSSETALPNKVSTEPGLVDKTAHDSSPFPKTPLQNRNNIIDPAKANVSANNLLSQVRSAAANLLTLRGQKPLDRVADFISVYRNSVYRNGSNYKLYNGPQSRRKRKSLDSVSGSQVEDARQPAKKSPRSSENMGMDMAKEKQAVETLDRKLSSRRKPRQETATLGTKKKKKNKEIIDKEPVEEKDSPAYLFATFGSGSALPTKADLIRVYGKYGDLDEKETDMFYDSFVARICFVKHSDAEVALNDSEKDSPFVSANVSFRLQYRSGVYKTRELTDISSQRAVKTPKKPSKLQANGGEQPDLGFVQKKLETISSMLEDKHGEVSSTMKSRVQVEIKDLLEKVSTMVGSSS